MRSSKARKTIYDEKRESYRQGTNPSRLRNDIDSGRTGDKVQAEDPAMAPLGTDEEAAGTPLHPMEVWKACQQERKN